MKVYALWHVHELSYDFGNHDEEKMIGVFSSKEKARHVISELKNFEGFRDYPIDCFEIHEMEMDRAGWRDRFTTVRYNVWHLHLSIKN